MHGSTGSNGRAGPGLLVRAASVDDRSDIRSVLDACSQRWHNRPTSEASVSDRLAQPGTSIDQDTVLITSETGTVLAFGHTWPTGSDEARFFGRVHPRHRGRGIGTVLVDELLARCARHGGSRSGGSRGTVTTTTPSLDVAAAPLLTAHGFRETRFVLQMVSELGKPRPPRRVDGSILLRTFRPGEDEDQLYAAFMEAFADHWGFEAQTPEAWWFDHRDAADAAFDQSMWFLAVDDDELVGFSLTKIAEDDEGTHGYVSQLGVRPGWRGRGLGYALLDRSLEAFETRGLSRAKLDVDAANITDALRVYRKAGMRDRPAFTIWTASL